MKRKDYLDQHADSVACLSAMGNLLNEVHSALGTPPLTERSIDLAIQRCRKLLAWSHQLHANVLFLVAGLQRLAEESIMPKRNDGPSAN